jgi:hypothetical protein
VRNQSEAFEVYYSAMPDDELLRVAQNSASLVPAAQAALGSELRKRCLEIPVTSLRTTEDKRVLEARIGRACRVSFSSSFGQAARAQLETLGWAILIVTAAWGHARQYKWIAESLRLDDGGVPR